MKSMRSTLHQRRTEGASLRWRERRALQRLAALALVVASAAIAPATAQAATVTLYPTANTTVGTVTSPANALTDTDAGAAANVSANNSSLTVSGFDATDRGTISDVTVYAKYKTSATPSNDTYQFDAALDGSTFGTSILAPSLVNQSAYVVAQKSLGAIGWSQVGTMAVRSQTVKSGAADAYTVDVDVAYAIVTYTAASGTITLADGTNPGTVSITAAQVGALDGFSLVASTGAPVISSVTVNVSAGNAALSGLSINSLQACNGTSYGSIASVAAGANTITTSGLSAGTTAVTYYVCGTAATVGSNTTVAGTVSAVTTSTAGFTVSGSDPSGATSFTVTPPVSNTITLGDGTNPGTVSIAAGQTGALDGFSLVTSAGTAAISSVTVNVSAGNAALSGLSINSLQACNGTSYGSIGSVAAGANTITTSGLNAGTTAVTTYVCATGATVGSNTTVAGTVSAVTTSTAGYTVSGSDPSGATSFTVQATTGTTTVGDWTNPPDVPVLAPGGVAKAVDAFTLQTSVFTDTVQTATVTLAANVWQGIEAVSIQDVVGCTQATPFGSSAPSGSTVTIPVAGLVASTTLKNLWVCVKPKAHAAMPLPPGGTYAVTGKVTGITSSFTPSLGDTSASATVTIDNASPANVTWGAVTTAATSVTLNWTNPGGDFASVVVLRRQGGPVADVPAEGSAPAVNDTLPNGSVVRYILSASPFTDTSLTGGQPYYYAIFAKDGSGNYAPGTSFGPVYPGTNALPAGDTAAGSTKPVVGIVNPGSGSVAAAGTSFRVQVRVWSPGAAITAVAVTYDNGATWPLTLSQVPAYGGGATSGIWGGTLSLPTAGGYTLVARATSSAGTTYSRPVGIAVRAAGGDGNLLVRDNASQLCTDCHAMVPHSSEATGTQYGSWTTTCRDCHAPHGTTNIFLVANAITPPAVGGGTPSPKGVYFTNTSGYASSGGAATRTGSYANGDSTGVCQACHTRTQDPVNGNARYRNGGGGTSHNATEPCKNCHAHGSGFAPTNKQCSNCHLGASDLDVWTSGGATPIIATAEWTSYGHGAVTSTGTGGNYPSGNVTAKFDGYGSAIGDRGCFYCHSSSTSHNDPTNWFRLDPENYNTTSVRAGGDGWNSVCLVCHGKTATWSAPGFDPDGAGTAYPLVTAAKKLGYDHYGPSHSSPDNNGGNFCWDCHDPHGDKSASSAELWFMLQTLPVEQTTGTSSGVPDPAKLAAAIEFRGNLGGDLTRIDFPDYIYVSGSSKGICRNCHDADSTPTDTLNQVPGVNHYSKTISDGHNSTIGIGLSPRDRCTDCHVHAKACNECHDSPQTAGRHPQHNQVASLPTSYTETSSEATATQYGYRCGKCHMGTHPKDTHSGTSGDPFVVDMIFDASADPKNTGATYAIGTAQTSIRGLLNGDYANSYWSWSDGTCASVYCHSNGAPLGVTPSYPTGLKWVSSVATTCTSCHGAKDVATPAMSAAHAKHINTGYAYGCERCHASVVTSSSAFSTVAGGGKVLHVNGTKDVAFDAAGPNNSGGSYSKATYTCSNIYCHSDGTDTSPGYVSGPSIAWNGGSTSCSSCHLSGTAMATGKHTQHVNNNAVLGTSFVCANCHNSVVASGNSPITSTSLHVNGSVNVAFAAIGSFTGGTYASPTCSSFYCHSSGQASPGYISVAWTGAALGCNGCHGVGTTYGEPNYANGGAGAATANSHAKHVSAAADCAKCHTGTTTSGTAIVLSSTLHIDGSREVTWDATRQSAGATYASGTKTCGSTGGSCHAAGTPQWGAVVSCLNCHGTTGAETDDFGASFWNNGIMATINTTEWTWSGHGKTSGTYDVGNAAAAFPTTPTAGTSECLYCHDSSVGHGTATNPYRLLNVGGADGQNGNCLVCHKTGSAGVTPSGQTLKNGTIKADTAHDGAKHTLTTQGGTFCWDCHDPHGDRPSNTNSSGYNIEMIRSQIFVKQDGVYGYLGSAGVQRAVEYYSRSAPAVPSPVGNIEETTTPPPTAHKGICQACHDPTSPAPNPATAWTKYWGYTGYDDPDGSTGAAPYASGAAVAPTHNPTGYCITCHKHSAKFVGSGGGPDCRGCHGTGAQGSRRPVDADFANGTTPNFRSHHVGNGGAQMGGTLSNADCAVCHAEAAVSGGVITGTDPTYHANGKIDLRNVDSTTAVFIYDRDAVAASAGAAANWNSGNAVWRTQTSTNLDPFCINCHDSDGASQIAAFKADAAATALNPFNDGKITNEYDQNPRCDGTPTTVGSKPPCVTPNLNGRVVDVKSMVTGSPPPQGIYSRHAIRGQSTSIYTKYTALGGTYLSIYEAGRFTSMGTDEGGKPNWNDTSVMGCADCHTTDGANGAAGNAHGSSSEYLLKDSSGGALEGNLAALNYVCYRCHFNNTTNHYYSGGTPHTGNGGDWVDYTAQVGTARVPFGNTGGNWQGTACGTCHGTTQFGSIHGTSQVFLIGSGPSTRNANRFTNGASMRYYDPLGWTGTQSQCYTLGTGETGWAGCTKHSGGSGNRSKAFARPVAY